MKFDDLLKRLNSLRLPKDQYVIVGSGPLAARGIRDTKDLDVIVSDNLWNQLSHRYLVRQEFSVDKISLGSKDIEILGEGSAFRDPKIATIEEMISSADDIGGYPFLNLNLLRKFKEKMGREKDLKDIGLIDQYLTKQNNLLTF